MEPWKTPQVTDHFHSWLQSFKSTCNTWNGPLPLATWNKHSAVVFENPRPASRSLLPSLNTASNLSMQTRCLPKYVKHSLNQCIRFSLRAHSRWRGMAPGFVHREGESLSERRCISWCCWDYWEETRYSRLPRQRFIQSSCSSGNWHWTARDAW